MFGSNKFVFLQKETLKTNVHVGASASNPNTSAKKLNHTATFTQKTKHILKIKAHSLVSTITTKWYNKLKNQRIATSLTTWIRSTQY